MMKAIVVEDEKNSREVLSSAIDNFTEGVEIIGEAYSVETGVEIINELQPDVLFLDIELPDGKGFDILDKVDSRRYKIIFVTAYDDYAIKAIRYAAFDYLVKPLDLDDLESAIERLKNRQAITSQNIDFLTEQIENKSHGNKIMVPSHNGYRMIHFDNVLSVEANSNYVYFILEDGNKHLASHSLSYYEDLLPNEQFFRIHKSHIVNFTKIDHVEPGRTGKAILKNGLELDIASRRKAAFMAYMKKYNSY